MNVQLFQYIDFKNGKRIDILASDPLAAWHGVCYQLGLPIVTNRIKEL